MSRTCGECDVCCTYFPAHAVGKPQHKMPCPQLRADRTVHRCVRYNLPSNHATCQNFECGWLSGLGEEDDRPDKSGVCVVPQNGRNHICVVVDSDVSATVQRLDALVAEPKRIVQYEET